MGETSIGYIRRGREIYGRTGPVAAATPSTKPHEPKMMIISGPVKRPNQPTAWRITRAATCATGE